MARDDFGDLLEQFLVHIGVERGLAKATVTAYTNDLRSYIDWLGARGRTRITEVTTTDVEEYMASRDSVSPRTRARGLAAIHELHKFAASQGIVPGDVSEAVKPPKATRELPDVLTVDEVEALLQAASVGEGTDPVSLRDRALLEFMYASVPAFRRRWERIGMTSILRTASCG